MKMTASADAPHLLETSGTLRVVAKPSGWAVYAAEPDERWDLLAWLKARTGDAGLAPVHRIDRETSGLVLYSSDPATRGEIGRWLAEGQVEKTYLALVVGRARDGGAIQAPLPDARRGAPLEARTRYRLVERLGGFSLLRVTPETGRKHQIRRHLQRIGHPVVGDTRYPGPRFVPVPAFPGRLWLHAAALALPDGRRFEADLPPELAAHLEVLRAGARPGP